MHDRIGKHIAYSFRAIFLNDFLRCILWQTIPVKLFSNCLFNKKYNTCKKSYYNIRKLSDELCKEHQLSTIVPGQQRGKKHTEWEAEKNGKSWKDKLRRDIDATIKLSNSYEDFIRLLRLKGYEVKGEEIGGSLSYISFRPTDAERFVRGSDRSLGHSYTRESIKERIETRDKSFVNFPYIAIPLH